MLTQDLSTTPRFGRVGMVARWRPVHKGHLPVLRGLCQSSEVAVIGIGSSNRYDYRNPFTFAETADMIRLVLPAQDNYELIPVPDLDDGPRWRKMIVDLFGSLDVFFTDNPYVAHLLAADYPVLKPVGLVDPADRRPVDGSMVRQEMARGHGWIDLVPPEVVAYIKDKGLDARFRREFGLQTLALEIVIE